MFWERFYNTCIAKGTKPNPVAKKIGISSGVLTKWKTTNTLPNGETLSKIADYLDVSVDYLLGKTDIKNPTANNDDGKNVIRIAGRDGSYIEKHLSDEQIEMLKTMINSLPDAPDDL